MAADKDSKSPIPFDPSTLIEAQRRNFEAFTSAGQIVADGMRTVAERQAAMMQEAMHDLWDEMRRVGQGASGGAAAKMPQPGDQIERLRGAFEKVTSQVQEMSGVLMRSQADAMEVLNRCAAANMEQLGKVAPELAAMQKAASEAVQAAGAQVTTAIEEMRRRMAELEGEMRGATKSALGKAASTTAASEPTPPPAAASSSRRGRAGGGTA